MSKPSPKQEVEAQGYTIRQVLEGEELSRIQAVAQAVYREAHPTPGEGPQQMSRPFIGAESPVRGFYYLAHDRPLLGVIEQILGGELVWEGAALPVSGPNYTQGWHRDVLQVPEAQVDEGWFSADVFFNNIQINMAFFDDSALWAVPGSHARPNTPEEQVVFAGTKHMSAAGVDMPGAVPIRLKAGQCVFYNNNIIHRGHNGEHHPRVTYHGGYARKDLPPTWHFYVSRLSGVDAAFIRTLDPPLRKLYDEHMAHREKYPDPKASYDIPDVVRLR